LKKEEKFQAGMKACGIGSFPHLDVEEALNLILANFADIPFWCQLPQRSLLESMNLMFVERLPGLAIRQEKLFVDTAGAFMRQVERFYEHILADDMDYFALNESFCQGFYGLLERSPQIKNACAVKGQVTGPFTLGMSITDKELKPIIYHPILADVLVKLVIMVARFQAKLLSGISERVLIFLDEPYLSAYGTSIFAVQREEIVSRLAEIYRTENIIWGTHCCSNTDWSLLIDAGVDIISLDAYQYAENLSLYKAQMQEFFARGGVVAWGVVPTFDEQIDRETGEGLCARLENCLQLLSGPGNEAEAIARASLVTPSCGMGLQTLERAKKVAETTAEVSQRMRDKYQL
jgi:hypothetical protein